MSRQVTLGANAPLRHQRLDESEHVCVMRRGHPLEAVELTMEDYCAAEHLLVSFSGRAHGQVDEALAGLGLQRRVVLAVNQYFTAGRVVARTDLLTVMPRAFLAVTGAAQDLVCRPLPVKLPPLQLQMVWHRRHDIDPAQRWLHVQVADTSPAKQGVDA